MISLSQRTMEYSRYPQAAVQFSCYCINTAFWASLIIVCGLLKVPLSKTRLVTPLNNAIIYFFQQFAHYSVEILNRFNDIDWHIDIDGELSQQEWYLLIANHQSWLDIILLTHFATKHIPTPKFFLKRELLYVPFVGLSAWAMDMPFMQRYSRQYLLKHPEKKGQDIETTRQACEKFKTTPTTVINFVEGTRCTEQKRKNISQYQHLLPPKAGGIAFTAEALPAVADNVLDVTLGYPHNTKIMHEAMVGKLRSIVIDVKLTQLPDNCKGASFSDPETRGHFQQWLNNHWQAKDQKMAKIYSRFH